MPVALRGQRELLKALSKADRETRLGVRKTLRAVAEPVRSDAQQLAGSEIPRMQFSPKWAGMRVGVTQKLVYVAPRRRGTKDPKRKRPNLAGLLMDKAMEPALRRHEAQIERELDHALDVIADGFNHGGPV